MANIKTPKKRLILSIHTPARGNKLPADKPSINKGTPIPSAMANMAAAPTTTSRVWLIYTKAPSKGPVTHGPTIKAEIARMGVDVVWWERTFRTK